MNPKSNAMKSQTTSPTHPARASAALLLLAGLATGSPTAEASLAFTETYSGVNLAIPDGFPTGVSDTRTVSSGLGSILNVKVSLELTGGYTGDLYALLIHDGVSAVLLNRPGRRAGDTLGYADSGLTVTFSDAAAQDVHTYRVPLTGNHTTPLGGPLTGTWQPDARTADPGTVLDTSPRSGFLSSLIGHTPDGTWTLFLADLSPVGEAMLKSWSIEVTAVPEPAELALGFGMGLLGWAVWRRWTTNQRCRRSGEMTVSPAQSVVIQPNQTKPRT